MDAFACVSLDFKGRRREKRPDRPLWACHECPVRLNITRFYHTFPIFFNRNLSRIPVISAGIFMVKIVGTRQMMNLNWIELWQISERP